jgi:hypothetical protein
MFAPKIAPKRQAFSHRRTRKIERRTFVGQTSTMGFDDYTGFRMGKEYQLCYTREVDEVRIALDHAATPGWVLTITVEKRGGQVWTVTWCGWLRVR